MVKKPDGALEAEILSILWSYAEGLTPGEVRDQVSGDPAYTTVATILTRLVDKGFVERRREGRSFTYAPALSETDWLTNRLAAVLEESRHRNELLAGFLGKLSTRDIRELRNLLDEGRSR